MKKIAVIFIKKNTSAKGRDMVEISKVSGINMLAEISTSVGLSSYLSKNNVDIALMEDNLPDEEQCEVIEILKELPVSLIYVTSNKENLLKAFEAGSLYCIVKPLTYQKLLKALQVWRYQKEKFENVPARVGEYMSEFLNHKTTYPKRVYLNMVGKTAVIQLDQLLYITSVDNYSQLVLADGVTYSSSRNIKKYSDYLNSHPDFIKAHKSHMINKKYVAQIHREKNNKVYLEMADGAILEVAQNRKEEILRAILN